MEDRITTKKQFYRLFHAGRFGNHSPMWDTLDDYLRSGYAGPVAIRSRVPGGRCEYDISRDQFADRWSSFLLSGQSESDLHISAMVPVDCITLQGEVYRSQNGLDLFCSFSQLPMRHALAESGFQYTMLTSKWMLETYMDPTSWDWFSGMLDDFPDHAIEFTCLREPWGVLPWNTVFWEVRAY